MNQIQGVLSRQGARELDQTALEKYGLPTIVLMENASRGLAEVVARVATLRSVVFVCGAGNNGGDGFGAARHLSNMYRRARVLGAGMGGVMIVTDRPVAQLEGDARTNALAAEAMSIPVFCWPTVPEGSFGVVVDALIGTGLKGRASGRSLEMIEWMNSQRATGSTIVSADLPSGMDADLGVVDGAQAVQADHTVTFAAPKRGFLQPGASRVLGEVSVADIGLPLAALEAALEAGVS